MEAKFFTASLVINPFEVCGELFSQVTLTVRTLIEMIIFCNTWTACLEHLAKSWIVPKPELRSLDLFEIDELQNMPSKGNK